MPEWTDIILEPITIPIKCGDERKIKAMYDDSPDWSWQIQCPKCYHFFISEFEARAHAPEMCVDNMLAALEKQRREHAYRVRDLIEATN